MEMNDVLVQKNDKKLTDEVWGTAASHTYGGVVLKVDGNGIWIWGRSGPKYFYKVDGQTVYFFYDTFSFRINLDSTAKRM